MKDHAARTHESRLVDRSSLVGLHFLGEMESKTIKENMGEWRGVKGSPRRATGGGVQFCTSYGSFLEQSSLGIWADSEHAVGWDLKESGSLREKPL
jgi:hypothetical protein